MSDKPERTFRPISPVPGSDENEENRPADNNTASRSDDPSYQNRRRVFSGSEEPDTPGTPECEEVAAINEIPDVGSLRINSPEIQRPQPMRAQPNIGAEGEVFAEIKSPVKVPCVVKSLSGEKTAFSDGALVKSLKNIELVSLSIGDPPTSYRAPGETCDGSCTGGRGPCPGSCMVTSVKEVVLVRDAQQPRQDTESTELSTPEVSSSTGPVYKPLSAIKTFRDATGSPSGITSTTAPESESVRQSSESPQQPDTTTSSRPCTLDLCQPSCSGVSSRTFAAENQPPPSSGVRRRPLEASSDADTTTECSERGKENAKKKKPQPKPPGTCGLQNETCRKDPFKDDDDEDSPKRDKGGKGKGSLKGSPR